MNEKRVSGKKGIKRKPDYAGCLFNMLVVPRSMFFELTASYPGSGETTGSVFYPHLPEQEVSLAEFLSDKKDISEINRYAALQVIVILPVACH